MEEVLTPRRHPGGVRVLSSLHNQKVESLQCLGSARTVLSVTITELSKAMVCGALSMGQCT